MTTTTECPSCTLRSRDPHEAVHAQSVRAQRALLAFLNGAEDMVQTIVAEIGGCSECLSRLAMYYLGNSAAALCVIYGSADTAASAVTAKLAEDIYSTPSPPDGGIREA